MLLWILLVSISSLLSCKFWSIYYHSQELFILKIPCHGINNTNTGNLKMKFNFAYDETRRGVINSKITFERFEGMDGTLTPVGNSYKNALRSPVSSSTSKSET